RRQQPRHECAPPTIGTIPAIGAAGNIGDLWRCDCGRLWRVTDANQGSNHMIHGKTWRPATLWQRLRYAGATPDDTATDPQYPFLEEGKVVNGQHYRRGPGGWESVPDPQLKYLKPALPRRRRLWRRTA